jgi:TRAP-type C4-dicarboxylate transport system permease small subunit
MEELLDRVYRVIRFFLDTVIGGFASLVLIGATGLALVEIVRRYLFGLVFEWGQDAVTYMIVASVFLYFAVTQGRRAHLVMGAATDAMKAAGWDRTVLWCRTVVTVLMLALSAGFCWWGIPAVERAALMGRKTQSMMLELWPFQLALVIGFGMMALVALFQLYQDIQALRGRRVFPWAPSEDTTDI